MRNGRRPAIEPIQSTLCYIGDSTEFNKAIAEFARAYADQTEQDWRALLNAIAVGRIAAEPHTAGQPP
jgi:Uncharacterized protein conserved in bacteria (DUF2252)